MISAADRIDSGDVGITKDSGQPRVPAAVHLVAVRDVGANLHGAAVEDPVEGRAHRRVGDLHGDPFGLGVGGGEVCLGLGQVHLGLEVSALERLRAVELHAPPLHDRLRLGQPGRPFRRVDYVYIAAPEREITHLGESLMWPNGMIASDGMTQFHISDHVPLLHVFAVGGPGAADAD